MMLFGRHTLPLLVLAMVTTSSRIAAEERAQEIIFDLTGNEYIYVGGSSSAIDPKTNECHTVNEAISQPLHPACLPDPFNTLCAINAGKIKEHWKQNFEKSKSLITKFDKVFESVKAQLETELGRPGDHLNDQQFLKNWNTELDRRINTAVIADNEAEVKDHVKKAAAIYSQMLRESKLPTHITDTLIHYIEACSANPVLRLIDNVEGTQFDSATQLNAFMPGAGWKLNYDEPKENKQLVIDPASSTACSVILYGRAWNDCAEGSASCYQTLFHEFAHLMNTCSIRNMVLTGENYFNWFEKNVTLPKIPVTNKVLQHTYEVLKKRTECLEELSHPHEGLEDDGSPIQNDSGFDAARCTGEKQKAYPSQWSESESDFWGASALATYLRSMPEPERRKIFAESVAQWCEGVQAHERVPPSKYLAYVTSKLTPKPPEPTSVTQPKTASKSRIPPWNDSHQDWSVRVNRNILRNADLRDTLGCVVSSKRSILTDIPVSCSPKGFQYRLFP